MKEITISVRLFGAFREYGEMLEFTVHSGSPVAIIKERLGELLGKQAKPLVMDSVLADEKTILPSDYVLSGDMRLSVLPPVCGG